MSDVELERRLTRMEARIERLEGQVSDAKELVGTVPQVARRLGCSEWKVRELIRTGRLPILRLGDNSPRVSWRALERWVETHLEFETTEIETTEKEAG